MFRAQDLFYPIKPTNILWTHLHKVKYYSVSIDLMNKEADKIKEQTNKRRKKTHIIGHTKHIELPVRAKKSIQFVSNVETG